MRPSLSVILPCHRREALLAECLAALARQTLPADEYEVIVVDDGSPVPLAEGLPDFPGMNLRFARQSQSGPAKARNTGAALAKGSVLAFIDSDCQAEPAWLEHMSRAFRQSPSTTCLAGKTVNALTDNLCSEASQALIDYLFQVFDSDEDGPGFVTSGNMACEAGAFHELGGFSEAFPLAAGEDRYFGFQWTARIGQIRFVPDAVVRHHHALTLPGFFRQHLNYGKGARTCHRLMRDHGQAPPAPQPFRFYRDLLRHPFQLPDRTRFTRLRLSLLMGGSQIANALGFLLGS